MFAVHPIHTEAVAGVVGAAELLCTALFCAALLVYLGPVRDARSAPRFAAGLAAVVLLGWAAALCKETGITLVRVFLC